MIAEFRGFLTKTNALALAIGVIIGAAVSNVVSALAADLLMPVIGYFLPGGDWRQGYVDVADIVNIGEADRGVVAARREEEPRDAPIGGGGEQADHDGDPADDRGGMEDSLHRLPQQQCTDE